MHLLLHISVKCAIFLLYELVSCQYNQLKPSTFWLLLKNVKFLICQQIHAFIMNNTDAKKNKKKQKDIHMLY